MFPLKVQRGAVRRGLGAPQAAPGLPKAGRAAGKEGGRRGEAPEEAAGRTGGGGGRLGAPGASPASGRRDHGRWPRPLQASGGLRRRAAKRSSGSRGRVASRRSRSSCCRPRHPRRLAGSRAALAGAPRRRGDNGGRQSAGAARAPSPSRPPPRGLNPFAAPAAPGADVLGAPALPPNLCGPVT